MTPRSLQAAFRTLAGDPPATDADLLAAFLAGDEQAFAALVRRHGRLVWSACRALTRCEAEADDAFQATFLVLLRHARKVRDPARLPAWLHAAAYRVSANARRASVRRARRELAAAVPEATGPAVPGAAWDRALAAVHAAAAGLPDGQRVPFVLCCLDGLTPAEAADRLGWKPGTVASRLARAKDAVLARLAAKDLAVGALAGVGLLAPPASAVSRAAALTHAGGVVPASLLSLSHGVIGMSTNTVKALAAGVLLACGLGGTAGSVGLSAAQAQRPAVAEVRPDPAAELAALREQVKALEAQLLAAKAQHEAAAEYAKQLVTQAKYQRTLAEQPPPAKPLKTFKTGRFEYVLVAAGGLDADKVAELVTAHEARGWEFAGTAPMVDFPACVFRRPAGAPSNGIVTFTRPADVAPAAVKPVQATPARPTITQPAKPAAPATQPAKPVEVIDTASGVPFNQPLGFRDARAVSAAEAEKLRADIAVLQARLAELQPEGKSTTIRFAKGQTPLEAVTLAHLLTDLGRKKFGGKVAVSVDGETVTVTGDKTVTDWAAVLVGSLRN